MSNDVKITDLTELTTVADNDLVYVVDVSDTTDSPSGASRKAQVQNVLGNTTKADENETITGSWTFSGSTVIPVATVTAHQAALTMLETQITDGSLLARLAVNETVTGSWTFNVTPGLYPITAAETSAAVTPVNYQYEPGNVLRYGTNTTPGTTDMTTAIQNAFSLLGLGGHDVRFPPGTYLSNTIIIDGVTDGFVVGYGATIRWANAASTTESLRIINTCKNITIEGLKFKGDNRASEPNPQIGVHVINDATTNLNGLRVINCWFETLTMGVAVIADTVGTIQDVLVSGCHVTEMAGTVGGTGYGIFCNFGNTLGFARIVNNYIEKCHRHGIYLSRPRPGSVISGNAIYKHREGNGDSGLSAIMVARGQGCVITDNIIRESEDLALGVMTDTTVTLDDQEHTAVSGNMFLKNDAVDLLIGGGAPATSGALNNVLISDNVFYRDDATQFDNSIEIFYGKGVTICDNVFWAKNNYASLYSLINVICGGETSGTATYTDDLVIARNVFNGSGTNFRSIRIDDIAADSAVKMTFDSNIFHTTGSGLNEFYIVQGTHTNTNIRVLGQRHRGLTTGNLLQVSAGGGTATILSGSTSIAVTHGLLITPVNHQITITPLENPTNDPGNFWISGITSSQFTINCRTDPGASNLDVAWRYHPIE